MLQTSKQLCDLTDLLGAQFKQARDAYALSLRLSQMPHPMAHLIELFKKDSYTESKEISIAPYVPIVPRVWMGFEKKDDISLTLRPIEPRLSKDADECDLDIAITNADQSRWLTIEVELDFQFLRPAEFLTVSIFGSFMHAATENQDDPQAGVQILYHDMDGTRHDLFPQQVPMKLPSGFGQARADLKTALPVESRINFDRSAILAVFLPTNISCIQISDFAVLFE
ncbi:hypothetical protein [Pseudaestuariivita rosea]|uniref:hypothetical protein n=1 Tax=Pseudaestuariivita rosea TaxID=2763263 RepID=UPI001ABA6C1E|nr:hypothetical protein [Pseudaestuariivita rosea]